MASKNPLQIEVYFDENLRIPGWRWRMWRSGNAVATGPIDKKLQPFGYVKRAQCRRTLLRLMATISGQSYVWKNNSGQNLRKR